MQLFKSVSIKRLLLKFTMHDNCNYLTKYHLSRRTKSELSLEYDVCLIKIGTLYCQTEKNFFLPTRPQKILKQLESCKIRGILNFLSNQREILSFF